MFHNFYNINKRLATSQFAKNILSRIFISANVFLYNKHKKILRHQENQLEDLEKFDKSFLYRLSFILIFN